jgi:hypothetical protein
MDENGSQGETERVIALYEEEYGPDFSLRILLLELCNSLIYA